jgi:hypothetical protein
VNDANEELDVALERLAQQVVYNAVQDVEWESYPEIGEHDWERVCERLGRMARPVNILDYREAYALLERRTNGQES